MGAPNYVKKYFKDVPNYESDNLFGTASFLVRKEKMNDDGLEFVRAAQSDHMNYIQGVTNAPIDDVWESATQKLLMDRPLVNGVEGDLHEFHVLAFEYEPPVYIDMRIIKIVRWLMNRAKELIVYPSPSATVITPDKRMPTVAVADARTPEIIDAIIAPIDPQEYRSFVPSEPPTKTPIPAYVLKTFKTELIFTGQIISDRYVVIFRTLSSDKITTFLDYLNTHREEFIESDYACSTANEVCKNHLENMDYDTPLIWDKNDIRKHHALKVVPFHYKDQTIYVDEKRMKTIYWFVGGKRTPLVAYTNADHHIVAFALKDNPATIVAIAMTVVE